MDLNAKAAYIKGLMEGMNFDVNTNEGKLISAMLGLLEDLAEQVTEHDDELDAIDEDMDDLESVVYDVDDEDYDDEDDGEDAEYELTCPNCGTVLTVDEETLMNDELYCPNCSAPFNVQVDAEDEKQ